MEYATSENGSIGSGMGLNFLINKNRVTDPEQKRFEFDAIPENIQLESQSSEPSEISSGSSTESCEDDDDVETEEEPPNAQTQKIDPLKVDNIGDKLQEVSEKTAIQPSISSQMIRSEYKVPPNATHEDIKRDLLYQFDRLERKGYKIHRRFSMASSLDDMRYEYDRMVRDKKMDASVRFQQTCLMGFATGVELLNNRFDPFDLKLDGWSENLHTKMSDFDDTFEELALKYSSDRKMAPEIKLIMSILGSAFMFHMTKKLTETMPGIGEILNQNPDLQRQFAGAAAGMMKDNVKSSQPPGSAGLAGMFSNLFGGKSDTPGQKSSWSNTAPAQPEQTNLPPDKSKGKSSAAEVLDFMRSKRTLSNDDKVEVMSQSESSEISEVLSLDRPKPGHRKGTTLTI